MMCTAPSASSCHQTLPRNHTLEVQAAQLRPPAGKCLHQSLGEADGAPWKAEGEGGEAGGKVGMKYWPGPGGESRSMQLVVKEGNQNQTAQPPSNRVYIRIRIWDLDLLTCIINF